MRKLIAVVVLMGSACSLAGCVDEQGNPTPATRAAIETAATGLLGPWGGVASTLATGIFAWGWQKMRHNRTLSTVTNLAEASLALKEKYPEAYALLKAESARLLAHNPMLVKWQHNLLRKAKGERAV